MGRQKPDRPSRNPINRTSRSTIRKEQPSIQPPPLPSLHLPKVIPQAVPKHPSCRARTCGESPPRPRMVLRSKADIRRYHGDLCDGDEENGEDGDEEAEGVVVV